MQPKDWIFGQEAREKIFAGMETCYKAVSSTLGPYGQTVAIDRRMIVQNTKDGVSVAEEVAVKDKFEEIGVKIIKEASQLCNEQSGDGTTTTVIIAYSLCKEWMKYGDQKLNTIKVKKGITKAVAACVGCIKKQSKQIKAEEDFRKVATISSQDEEIGRIVASAYIQAGENGAIDIERMDDPGIQVEHTDGLSFNKGYASAWFVNDLKNMRSVQEDVPVLVTDKEIRDEAQILPIMESLAKSGKKKLLIICDKIEGEAKGFVNENCRQKLFHTCVVHAPSYGPNKINILEDICCLTGATFLSEGNGMKLERASLEHLGNAKRVTVTHEKTVIVSDNNIEQKKSVSDRIDLLRSQIEAADPGEEKENLQLRLATLTDGITLLKVGAHSEIARHEEKARVEDAVRSVKSAYEEGVTVGGGTALLRCVKIIDDLINETKNDDERIGMKLVKNAIQAPALKVLDVAGIEDKEYIVAKVKDASGNIGYDFESGELKDLMKKGVMDAAKVVRCALQNAASVASQFITLGVACSPDNDMDTAMSIFKGKLGGNGN